MPDLLSRGDADANVVEPRTASFTLTKAHDGKWITVSNASSTTVTVPVGLPIGFNCVIQQIGAGTVSIAAGTGATVNKTSTTLNISAQYGAVTLFSYSANTFLANGLLT